ncbi:aromatic amino acid ammonia-lyase [Rhodococcus opacus]|uniref:aromatic amino acid ammonia-lyase n=1 Tax=Rhodococcus opacus TaxID=37919 RepID=UPI0007CD6158|nr:aromatic amino acid ammonia-lyase [Rhodococcus opacus]MDX5967250.1 aromatic amino acid ammonia-lyase [Rhodococcus opacus]NKY71551.1 aromatic amino acid lyase [Rhodococcus opacus]CAG7585403.1 Histidine ammonia-lyase [Rhodococcus opacus]
MTRRDSSSTEEPHPPLPVVLDGAQLTVDQLTALAREPIVIEPDPAALDHTRRSWETAVRIAERQPIYGRTTGVGGNRDTSVSDGVDQDLRLLRSHATGSGPSLPDHVVRAAMIIRVNQILNGGSGLHPDIVTALIAAVAADEQPTVHARGAIGTGDLSAFSEIALGLMGEAPLRDGRFVSRWTAHQGDALPLISTNAMTVALAASATDSVANWLEHSLIVGVLSLLATRSSVEPFAARVQAARRHLGQEEVAGRVRELLAGHRLQAARVQDSYGFRALPQILGATWQALQRLRGTLAIEMNSSSENPLISVEDDAVFHNGNFHGMPIALAVDEAKLALSSAALLSQCRLANLSDPVVTGLRPFLADGPAGSSGTMLLEYTTSAAIAEIRMAAAPGSLGHTVISRGTEDHASFASQAATQLTDILAQSRIVLACELISAVRALGQQNHELDTTTELGAYLDRARRCLDPRTTDRPLSDDLKAAVKFLEQMPNPEKDVTR